MSQCGRHLCCVYINASSVFVNINAGKDITEYCSVKLGLNTEFF